MEEERIPIHERIEEVEVIWQIPNEANAVLLIAHAGCGSPSDFWKPHELCMRCKGLPEHTKIVQFAISQQYAVLAVKSVKDYWQSWPLEVSQDVLNVEMVLEKWTKQHKLDKLPLAGLGCASGGTFLSALALRVHFSALILMTSHGVSRAFHKASNRYPPTLFVHMPKDSLTSIRIEKEIQVLLNKGIHANEITCLDFPVTPGFFVENIPHMIDAQASSKLYAALIIQGVLDGEGFVMSTIHSNEVVELLYKADILTEEHGDLERERLVESVNSLLKLAEARHAVSASKCDQIFTWLRQHVHV